MDETPSKIAVVYSDYKIGLENIVLIVVELQLITNYAIHPTIQFAKSNTTTCLLYKQRMLFQLNKLDQVL